MLLAVHNGLAAVTGAPEFAIDQEEAEGLAKAAANVARHYNTPKMAQKTIDWLTLGSTLGAVYGTRIAAYRLRTADARREAREREAQRRRGGVKPPGPSQPAAPAAMEAAPAPARPLFTYMSETVSPRQTASQFAVETTSPAGGGPLDPNKAPDTVFVPEGAISGDVSTAYAN